MARPPRWGDLRPPQTVTLSTPQDGGNCEQGTGQASAGGKAYSVCESCRIVCTYTAVLTFSEVSIFQYGENHRWRASLGAAFCGYWCASNAGTSLVGGTNPNFGDLQQWPAYRSHLRSN